jgi:hypothetical protein
MQLCARIGCKNEAFYGFKNDYATHCPDHIHKGMICDSIESIEPPKTPKVAPAPKVEKLKLICTYSGCSTRPNFGSITDTIPSRCKEHKDGCMINLNRK